MRTDSTVLTPGFLVATARALVGQRLGLSSTAFVALVGRVSHVNDYTGKSSWPLPLPAGASVDDLHRAAAALRILSTARPEPGEIFLLWSPRRRTFVHTGIVGHCEGGRKGSESAEEPMQWDCITFDGDVAANGSIGGGGVHRVRRMLSPARGDLFVRWADLALGDRTTGPKSRAEECAALMAMARAA